MKKFVFITGAVSISLTMIAVMFKLMHWPGAGVILLAGVTIFALMFIPTLSVYLYKNTK